MLPAPLRLTEDIIVSEDIVNLLSGENDMVDGVRCNVAHAASAPIAAKSGDLRTPFESAVLLHGDAELRSRPASSICAASRPSVGRFLEHKTAAFITCAKGRNGVRSGYRQQIAPCRTRRPSRLLGTL